MNKKMNRALNLWGFGFLITCVLAVALGVVFTLFYILASYLGTNGAILFLLTFIGLPLFLGWLFEDRLDY